MIFDPKLFAAQKTIPARPKSGVDQDALVMRLLAVDFQSSHIESVAQFTLCVHVEQLFPIRGSIFGDADAQMVLSEPGQNTHTYVYLPLL